MFLAYNFFVLIIISVEQREQNKLKNGTFFVKNFENWIFVIFFRFFELFLAFLDFKKVERECFFFRELGGGRVQFFARKGGNGHIFNNRPAAVLACDGERVNESFWNIIFISGRVNGH